MTDTTRGDVATITFSDHSRLLLARTATPKIRYDTQQRLHDDARAFNDILNDHLDREEAIIVPAFESTRSLSTCRASPQKASSSARSVATATKAAARTTMVAEAYQGEIGFQLYDCERLDLRVRIVEQLVVRDGQIRSSRFVTDTAAFMAVLGLA